MTSALYDSFIADYYDESPVVKGRTQDVAFYRDAARDFGDPVLELGCGTGRITMALAEAGKRITGLDNSERMLERAVKKRAALPVEARERVHLVQGNMVILDVFQTDAERMHDPVHMREMLVTEYNTADGRRVKISERVAAFHRAEQINDVEMIFSITHKGGREERLVFAWPLRYFFRYEVEHLLARSGFKVTAEHGNFDRTPVQDDSPEMIFVAEFK